jgi:hypothetical protein
VDESAAGTQVRCEPHLEASPPAELSTGALFAAAASFKAGTAHTDGLRPGTLFGISTQAMHSLAGLLLIAELIGEYPECTRQVITTLIPKTDGGLRPINLFPAVYRLHSRARSGILKAWAAGPGRHTGVNMAAHRHTADGVYRWLMRHATGAPTAAASGTGTPAATVLWDFKKAFENVRRDLLLQAAVRFSFPIWWLRLSLASYSWPRILTVEHAGAPPMVPKVGIAAGAMSATFELHLYLLGMLHAHQQQLPGIGLTLHVDDLIRDFRGSHQQILTQVDESNALVRSHLQDLSMPLAHDKEQVVATTYRLAQQVSNISRSWHHGRSYGQAPRS